MKYLKYGGRVRMRNEDIYKDLREFAKKYKNHPKLPEAFECVNLMMGDWSNPKEVSHAAIKVIFIIEDIKTSINE